MKTQSEKNLEYYGILNEGREDYWRLMPAPRYRVRKILELLVQDCPESVLDVGCGDGRLLAAISQVISLDRIAGVDISAAQIEKNRQSMPSVQWYVADVDNDPLKISDQFGAIVASELIEHLSEPISFLEKLHDVAERDALLVITTQSGTVGETEKRVGHLRHFSKKQMERMLEQSGWTVIRVWNTGFPFHNLSKWIANLVPDTSMSHFANRRYGIKERFAVGLLRGLFVFNSRRRGSQLFATARRTNR